MRLETPTLDKMKRASSAELQAMAATAALEVAREAALLAVSKGLPAELVIDVISVDLHRARVGNNGPSRSVSALRR